jgi:hypothetical protein
VLSRPLVITGCGVLALLLLIGVILFLTTRPRPAPHTSGPPACTHWASPGGTGTTCTETAPCLVRTWTTSTTLAQPGRTLCLNDGTYLRSAGGTIEPLETIAGTADRPITVRALHDGRVLIDAEHKGWAVYLAIGNEYWHIWGLNARNGKESLYRFRSSHARGYRLIGWDGTDGEGDSNIFMLTGNPQDTVIEDCAGWGMNSRKIFEASQSTSPDQDMQFTGFRRCWGEFNDWPEGVSQPTDTYQLGYRSRQQQFENVIGTWDLLGQPGGLEAPFSFFYDCLASDLDVHGTRVVGSIFYAKNGQSFTPNAALTGYCTKNLVFQDVVGFIDTDFPTKRPFVMNAQESVGPQTGNVCQNCLAIHAGTPSLIHAQAGWTFPNFHEGQGLAAATGGVSPFVLLPAICKRYVQGTQTDTPLWPWPLEQRILEARMASGYAPVSVTDTVEAMLGTIPPQCRTDSTPIPPEPIPPGTTSLSCTGTIAQVPGNVTMECVPQTRRR